MNIKPSEEDDRRKEKARLYLTIAVALFMLMAFLWALESSIVYILAGSGTFLTFLALYHYPWKIHSQQKIGVNKPKPATNPFRSSQKQAATTAPTATSATFTPSNTGKKVFFFAIGGIILFFVIIGALSDDGADPSYYFNQAEMYRNTNEFDSSRHYYLKAIAEEPGYIDAWNNYGVLLIDQQRYDSAMYMFDRALDIDDSYEHARYNKALIHYYRKDYRKSLSQDLPIIDDNPYFNAALQLAGDNYYEQKKYDSALYWYQKGYDNGHRSAWLCHVMGYLYDVKGDSPTAIALYQEAVSYDPYKKDVYTRLGELVPGPDGEQYRMTAAELQKNGY